MKRKCLRNARQTFISAWRSLDFKPPIMTQSAKIWCVACDSDVQARLTNGLEIYPHRADLHEIPFWKCDVCKNYVGCHHKSDQHTKPLGCIATREIVAMRQQIHQMIDPLWKLGKMERRKIYLRLGDALGRQYHTADLRSVEEAQLILETAKLLISHPQ